MKITGAREEILQSIRTNLAASAVFDVNHATGHAAQNEQPVPALKPNPESLVELFAESLEAVDGHCVVVGLAETVEAIKKIIAGLSSTRLNPRRVAVSDSLELKDLIESISSAVEEVEITPIAADLFSFDVGISSVQAGIAETGTLVLEADRERNRLVSLVPPVHIAILDASKIFNTLGETLVALYRDGKVSQAITFISGPSRTADIELTLAIGVHGPQELFVIIRR
jgi:Uncharacterized conserved protein